MGRFALLVALGACVVAAPSAAESDPYTVYADVVDVEPLISSRIVTEPRENCAVVGQRAPYRPRDRYRDHRYREHAFDDEYAYSPPRHRGSRAATLLGGVIGGLVGSQFGGGSGKKVLAITGAMVGASMANRASRHRREHRASGYVPPRCTTVMESREVEAIEGYRVRYRYQGREFVKHVDAHPGDRIRVQVQVTPVPAEPGW